MMTRLLLLLGTGKDLISGPTTENGLLLENGADFILLESSVFTLLE